MANGVVGLKPTYGRVSRHGVLELAASLDHIGPITRSVRDAAIVFEAISGFDDSDSSSLRDAVPRITESLTDELSGMRIGVDEHYLASGTNPALVEAIHEVIEVLRLLGAEIVALSMPKSDPLDLRNAWLPICAYEAHKAHGATYPSRADEYGGYFGEVLKMGATMDAQDYANSTKLRRKISEQYESALEGVDAVICPSGGSVFTVEEEVQYGNMEKLSSVIQHFQGQFTIPADLAGTPTITVPCGFSAEGSPYAVQFLGSRLSELNLCRIAHAYERATQWHQRHPTI